MNIRFGTNEYVLVPGSAVQTLGDKLSIQILADGIDFETLEAVLKEKANVDEIQVADERGVQQSIFGYSKLDNIHKNYHVLYWTETVEHIITPESIDPETGETIPAEVKYETVEHYADILYVSLMKTGLEGQVEANTANIEFLAIMSDIELE